MKYFNEIHKKVQEIVKTTDDIHGWVYLDYKVREPGHGSFDTLEVFYQVYLQPITGKEEKDQPIDYDPNRGIEFITIINSDNKTFDISIYHQLYHEHVGELHFAINDDGVVSELY